MSHRILAPALNLALGLSLLLALLAGPAAAASNVPATVRVVTWEGKVLLDKAVKSGSVTVKTSEQADCLGGSPTNGRQSIPGTTALGILQQASKKYEQVRPLLLSNAFDFGLGLCGVGDAVAGGEQWWVLKLNHADSTAGGEGTVLKKNDVVLWYLAESYLQPTPSELYLKAPAKVKRQKSTRVRVLAFDSAGKKKPVEGASIRNSNAEPTNANGYTRVKLNKKTKLIVRKSGFITSNRVVVKVKK